MVGWWWWCVARRACGSAQKTQAFAVYIYIYTYVYTSWGLRTFKNQQTLVGGATESDRWSWCLLIWRSPAEKTWEISLMLSLGLSRGLGHQKNERHAIPYHFDDMLWFTVYSLLEYMIQFDYIVLFFWMNLWLTDGFLANSLAWDDSHGLNAGRLNSDASPLKSCDCVGWPRPQSRCPKMYLRSSDSDGWSVIVIFWIKVAEKWEANNKTILGQTDCLHRLHLALEAFPPKNTPKIGIPKTLWSSIH